jgi:glycosyltransferase involved in cell wall biosynthesis
MSMIALSDTPLISCLCVTKRRLEEIQGSIRCFLSQTYPNKELIILHHTGDNKIKNFVMDYCLGTNKDQIIYIEKSSYSTLTLGELRNIAIEHCGGTYFCQWDDDDWYHNDRLKIQFSAMLNNFQHCSLLTNLIIFDKDRQNAYLTPFRFWENSILCEKAAFNNGIRYPALTQGEDSFFTNSVIETYGFFPLVAPNLYIYIIHGSNTWPHSHHEGIFSRSKKFPDNISQMINEIILGRIPNTEASDLLNSREVLGSFKYFSNINLRDKSLSGYIQKYVQNGIQDH